MRFRYNRNEILHDGTETAFSVKGNRKSRKCNPFSMVWREEFIRDGETEENDEKNGNLRFDFRKVQEHRAAPFGTGGSMTEKIIMMVMAFGVVIGALDWITGSRRGYGKKMEEGFLLLGPTAISMAGIICLAPVLAQLLNAAAAPLCRSIGLDPGIFGGFLAIDMGGFQLAKELAEDPKIGAYAGTVVAATFGCTLVFTIPMGMGLVQEKDQGVFAKGIMTGIVVMPAALFTGGILAGLRPLYLLGQSLPVFLLAAVILAGLRLFPGKVVRGFQYFASAIRVLTIAGLAAGAVSYMLGIRPPFSMTPIEEAMETVSSIGIVLLGSLPVMEFLQRILKKPLQWAGEQLGMNSASIAGLFISFVSVVPTITMLKDMDERGKQVNVACMVCAASLLAAHLGFTVSAAPDMLVPLLTAKCVGGGLGILAGLLTSRGKEKRSENV